MSRSRSAATSRPEPRPRRVRRAVARGTSALGWLPAALLAGCAAQGTLPALPESHPANPAAATIEPIRPSDLLRRTAPIPAAAPEPGVHDHHAHGVAEAAPPGQPEEDPAAAEHEHEAHEHHHEPEPPPPASAR